MPPIPKAKGKKQTGPKRPEITRRIIEKEIRVGLEGPVREEYTVALLKKLRTIESLEDEKKETVKTFNDQIKLITKEADSDRLTLEYGVPEIHEVEEVKDYKAKIVTYKRVDTQQVVEQREMGPDDMQMGLGEETED